jgi:hypothetical protein
MAKCAVCGNEDSWCLAGQACLSCVNDAMKGKPWPPVEKRPFDYRKNPMPKKWFEVVVS